MNNLIPSRHGFKYEHVIGTMPDGKTKLIRFEVSYLKSFSGKKGVLATITPLEVEQRDGYTSETMLLYNNANVSLFVKPLARKSDKEVVLMAEKLDPFVLSIMTAYLESSAKGREAIMQAAQ